MKVRFAATAAILGCLSSAAAQGRGDYFNVETPVGQALAVARIASHDYLLVCNTPDDSVEVWDTDESLTPAQRFLARIPVGMEPNSILWDGSRSRVYVTCFLNDSVESFTLSAPLGPASFSYALDRSRNLGDDPLDPHDLLADEPMDLALSADKKTLLVSFGSQSTIGAFDPVTLDPVGSSLAYPAPTDAILLQATVGSEQHVIKEPRPIEVFGDLVFVLNHKGGSSILAHGSNGYDFDLYSRDVGSGASAGTVRALGGLGTTNWNMRVTSHGDLYVVGGEALFDLPDGVTVATQTPTGFVKSMLYRVKNPGTASAGVIARDLNLGASGPVTPQEALAMPTDVVVLEGSPTKVYVAAFGSDRVGVVTLVNPDDPATWTVARIAITPVSTSTRSGPRALYLKPAFGPTGTRVYVLNRMDNSVSAFDPQSPSPVLTFALQQDPTPAHIRAGRPFLYSADLSANGFVSCASCHADGRTDALGWNLGSPNGFAAPFPRGFVDSPVGALLTELQEHLANGFSPNKDTMITQTLQGLLDTEVTQEMRDLVTNAPYHWRGDRARFTDFNEAFANLMQLGDQFGGGQPGDLPMGISQADMETFEEFVNSIHYPPNPKQLETRVFSGDPGTNPDDELDATLAQRGLKVFHMQRLPTVSGRSCIECHALPRGSNLKFTVGTFDAVGATTPLETAQLRGLFQREARFQADGYDVGNPRFTGKFGLQHNGGRDTINIFINLFAGSIPDVAEGDLKQFVHELDWGAAPAIGRVQRVTAATAATSEVATRLTFFESQVGLGHCGLAVNGAAGGGALGYWYDPTRDLYVEEASGVQTAIPRTTLLAMLTAVRHRLFFRCTPLGSERRIAAVDGSATPLADPGGPQNLQLLPMTPITAWEPVPTLDRNWIPGTLPENFLWMPDDPAMPTPRFLKALRRFQYGLIAGLNGYGLTALRHEAPRRLRIAGENVLPGAKLVLWTPADTSGAPPDTLNPPDPAKTRRIEFPLYATSKTSGSASVWETTVELAPVQYYVLMNGGVEAPGVSETLADALSLLPEPPAPGTFDPDHYNWHYVEVVNPDGVSNNAGWRQLKVQ